MRKPLRALAYVILFGLLFGLINVILRHFRILTTFNPFPRSGDIFLLWDDGSAAINHKGKQDKTLRADNIIGFLPENTSLSSFIQLANRRQLIRNEDLFGRLPSPSHADLEAVPDSVFVIQVHSRLDNLRLLIASLERVKQIERSLLVFSTDLISNELISLVNSIRFARTVQIYFPHSVQAFPVGFPGADCYGAACGKNKLGRDTYGHTRNENLTQIKHHWLWKFQFVFKDLVAIKHFTGHVIFLEEDYYVVEDILVVRRLVEGVWSPTKPNGVIAFGARVPTTVYHGNRTAIDYFISSQHNQGMGISRVMWEVISNCLSVFCEYDDYNWDWSLQELGRRCIKGGLRVLIFAWFSRVYHLGECDGVHHQHNSNCSTQKLYVELSQKLSGPLFSHLYPSKLEVISRLSGRTMMFKPSGGWGDPRDRALCHSIAKGTWNVSLQLWAPQLTTSRSPDYG
ncbi:hypothetical protein CRM22_009768 [Opisthorchis felineus]|uniref:Alpha-1,6-mannosyl-glycoprotein 2-beta-N-acetylglucosaminyltransferase n=1 Tax=Opisthorchis felineus TaxID=147828 RepID=A0A4S2L5D5_OPIFE|nr:hypothetical protein CRM22_009768 [Opisthorchis felineus]